jgi:hypothetical protein
MIVVIGSPGARALDGVVAAGGLAAGIALAAARSGQDVQLVGKIGDDPTADAVVLDLAAGGVSHVALLRESAWTTPIEAAAPDPPPIIEVDDDAVPAEPEEPEEGPSTPGATIDAGDVDLGLRYLTDYRVLVVAEPAQPDVIAVVAEAARWMAARMILVVGRGRPVPDDLPADVVVIEAPDADPDGAFAQLVGSFASALDSGSDPGEAFRASIAVDGWASIEAD